MKTKKIYLCAINNVLSGSCSEDCHFCTQSARYKASIDRYRFKSINQIVSEAREALSYGAVGYCLVTAGKGLDDSKCEEVARIAHRLKREFPSLWLIGCNGTATKEQLRELKKSGIDSYNHNLETSQEYYPKICSTHSWQERYITAQNVKSEGLMLCCGGIFGMGESQRDRDSLVSAVSSLKADAVPINFYIPNPALPIKECSITQSEAIDIIHKVSKEVASASIVMVAGGREMIFGDSEVAMYEAGANSIVVGDYLTTSGEVPQRDIDRLKSFGLEIAKECNG